MPPDLSLFYEKSSWHLQHPSQRSILNSWIIYQSLHLDPSIASHIHLKRTYQLKLSLRVLSVFGFMALPVACLLSVKRASLSSQLPRNHLGSKLLSNTGRFSTTLPCRLCFSIIQWTHCSHSPHAHCLCPLTHMSSILPPSCSHIHTAIYDTTPPTHSHHGPPPSAYMHADG